MKNATLCALLCSFACGPGSDFDPESANPLPDEPSLSAQRQALSIPPHSLTGISCGTVIPVTAGTYILRELSQLEAIDSSGCTYFDGNVRVEFTVPLVPSSQRYLFDVKNIQSVSGKIYQHGTKQTVTFAGLQSAGSIEVRKGDLCFYRALKSIGSLLIDEAGCSMPALERAGSIELSDSGVISGFAALQSVGSLSIYGDLIELRGFNSLAQAGALSIEGHGIALVKTVGTFPKLTTLADLKLSTTDVTALTLPQLTAVTGSIRLTACKAGFKPLRALQTVGATLTITPGKGVYDDIVGPATLTSLGGLTVDLEFPSAVSGFANLATVAGSLILRGELQQVSGFDSLTSVRAIQIIGKATPVHGFAKLASLNGILIVRTALLGRAATRQTFDAFAALSELVGSADLVIDWPATTVFPALKHVGGSLSFTETSWNPRASNGFPKLTAVDGALTVENQSEAFRALQSVGGTLKILDVPSVGPGYYPILGFGKVTHVGGDLVFDKNATSYHMQRILDRLIGFTGTVVLE